MFVTSRRILRTTRICRTRVVDSRRIAETGPDRWAAGQLHSHSLRLSLGAEKVLVFGNAFFGATNLIELTYSIFEIYALRYVWKLENLTPLFALAFVAVRATFRDEHGTEVREVEREKII